MTKFTENKMSEWQDRGKLADRLFERTPHPGMDDQERPWDLMHSVYVPDNHVWHRRRRRAAFRWLLKWAVVFAMCGAGYYLVMWLAEELYG